MDRPLVDDLKKRYAFDDWQGRNTLDENLFVWNLFLSGSEFPDWQAHRIQDIAAEGWPPSIQSIWQRADGETETLLRVDVYECVSRGAAHEFLLQALGEFQSPVVAREEQIGVGDVAFVAPGDAGILFARANLVVLVQNAGRQLVPVTEVTQRFDRHLSGRPDTVGLGVVPEIRRVQSPATEIQVGIGVPLEIEATDPLERPLWYKCFSSGEIMLEERGLVYQAGAPGPQVVTVFAINANGGTTSREWQLAAKLPGEPP